MECQVNVISQSELDIGGRETCYPFFEDHIDSFPSKSDHTAMFHFQNPVSHCSSALCFERRIRTMYPVTRDCQARALPGHCLGTGP